MTIRREALLFADGPRQWAALLVDGELEDLLSEDLRRFEAPPPGEVCAARVDRCSANGRVAFLDLGERRRGFLNRADGLQPGMRLAVQVDRYAFEGKAPRVTESISIAGELLVARAGGEGVRISRRIADERERERLVEILDPYAGEMRLVVRTRAAGADGAALDAEAERLAARIRGFRDEAETGEARTLAPAPGPVLRAVDEWSRTGEALWIGAGGDLGEAIESSAEVRLESAESEEALLEHGDLAGRIRAALQPRVELGGGAWMSIEPTTALVAVDVNAGAAELDRSGGAGAARVAARELPRQLRLRGLGGLVVVDFPTQSEFEDERLERAIGESLQGDPVGGVAHGWTSAGLFEITRRRDRRPIGECFQTGV